MLPRAQFDSFFVTVDGEDVQKFLRYGSSRAYWTLNMKPQQRSRVRLMYSTRGTREFLYEIPLTHPINNTEMKIIVYGLPVEQLDYPSGAIPPSEVQSIPDGAGSMLIWRLDRASPAGTDRR